MVSSQRRRSPLPLPQTSGCERRPGPGRIARPRRSSAAPARRWTRRCPNWTRSHHRRARHGSPRHAGFLNKALSDFNLALDLGFLTKNRSYTFFKPKFIIYATYLSEKIGYWRYISIYRHLQANPDSQIYPLFEYFENWCQDESRHGDFLAAILKARPELLNDWVAKLWSRFFCLSVYITMYLNDHQRSAFYESLGLNTTQFNQHVIIETNKSTERLFPAVPDVESPEFFRRMDNLVALNAKLVGLSSSGLPKPLQALAKLPLIERMVAEIFQVFIMTPKDCGSVDMLAADKEAQVVY